ncbi:hypothetical protein ACFQ58_02760 [Agromyces sp. NPDC056523]|uniref:hypothetical protein n=1 Tax=Agromyces sp. NPDC056523 TaxID=3345850 RepID=UPI003671C2B9
MSDLEEPKSGITRRTVAKAAAWSVPAIALAVPTPAYAVASPELIDLTGDGCKLPGNATDIFKGYAFEAVITNPNQTSVNVSITDITLKGEDLGAVTVVRLDTCQVLGSTFAVAGGASFRVAIITANAASSANGTLVVTYTADNVPDAATAQADAAPPITGGGACTTFTNAEKTCIEGVFTAP